MRDGNGFSPNHIEESVRRSSRKRRSPGEWWKEFSIETENSTARCIAFEEHGPTPERHERENHSSSEPEISHSMFSEEPLQPQHIPRGSNEGSCDVSPRKRRLLQSCSTDEIGNTINKHGPDNCFVSTGNQSANENQNDESSSIPDINQVKRKCQPPSNGLQNSTSRVAAEQHVSETLQANSCEDPPSAPGVSHGGKDFQPSSSTAVLTEFGDKSSLTTANPNSVLTSVQANTGDRVEDKPLAVQTCHEDLDTGEKRRGNRSKRTRTTNSDRLRWSMEASNGVEVHEDTQAFAIAENSKKGPDECTPQPSRRLFTGDLADKYNNRCRDLSKLRAPRKNRSQRTSPSYSFSLRPRLEPSNLQASLQKVPRKQQESGRTKREGSKQMEQKALVAKRSSLMHKSVTAYVGTVKVGISISLNKTTMGEVVILPRSATGLRRALTGDEFYIVKQGYVECDIGFISVTLFAGDHLGIPEGQSFEMRNPSASKSELFFFSPRTS